MKWTGTCLGTPVASLSVLLNVSYVNDYILFRGGVLNEFRDSKPFIKWRGWACSGIPPWDILVSVIECVLSPGTTLWVYGLCLGIWTVSKIFSLLWTVQGGACPGTPRGTSKSVSLNVSYHDKHEYIWLRGGDLNSFCDIRVHYFAQLHIHIYNIPKFQNNAFSG